MLKGDTAQRLTATETAEFYKLSRRDILNFPYTEMNLLK